MDDEKIVEQQPDIPCLLPRGMRNCGLYESGEKCRGCGWNPDENSRRQKLPLEEYDEGLRRKDVGRATAPAKTSAEQ